jgi:hypothetical protein
VDTLQLAVWNASSIPEGALTLTRFKLPHDAHETLGQWCREWTKRQHDAPITVVLKGLSEIMAWFVPEMALVRHDKDRTVQRNRLCLFFVGDVAADEALRGRVQAGLAMWLTILYPEKAAGVRTHIATTALDAANWQRLDIGSVLKRHPGACALPEDAMTWDGLAARAVAAIAGKTIRFRSGESRVLVAKTAQASAFNGIELVAFPPKRAERGDGFWSEVITVYTPSYPERAGLHILARPSIRNWGPVTRWAGFNDPNRSLDVFLPAPNGDAGHAGYRHTSFEFRPKRDDTSGPGPNGRKPPIGWWPHKEDQRVFDLLRRLTGRAALVSADLAAPVVDNDGLWVLPRLGTVHQDDRLAGGSGLPIPDRQDIAESLDRALGEAGFERTKPMQRVVTSMPLDGPFNVDKKELEEAYPRRRKSVLDALNALGNKVAELEFYVFHRLDRTPGVIVAELKEYLGEPASEDGMRLSWADGLSVRVVPCAGGPLSDALPRVDLTDEEREGRTRSQQEAIRMTKRDDALVAVEKHMAAHVQNVRGSSRTIGCAILEMPAALRDDRWHDPYSMARRELARWSVLPQVVLVDGKTNDADTPANKYCAAVRDCFRMLGVVPIEDIDLNLAPAAITVVQRNTEFVGGGRRDGHAFPLAARVRDGVLECAIPEESGEPAWMAYGLAALCILSGNYGKFGRGRQEENIAKFEVFFTAVLHQIDRRGSAIVIAEYETVASKLRTLENGRLTFDRLAIGNSSYAPADFPNLRLIRISSDPKKQPHYYHTTEVKWVSGLFSWEAAQRTFYGLKTKPPSVSTEQHFAAQTSRHVVLGDNAQRANDDAARVSAQIDEICVAFMQEDDNPELLATLTHRLRGVHAQYRYDTSAPFPLHELRLLGGGVTL